MNETYVSRWDKIKNYKMRIIVLTLFIIFSRFLFGSVYNVIPSGQEHVTGTYTGKHEAQSNEWISRLAGVDMRMNYVEIIDDKNAKFWCHIDDDKTYQDVTKLHAGAHVDTQCQYEYTTVTPN